MPGASRKGIGKMGAAAVVVLMIAVVVGVGGYFASQGPPEKLSAQQIISMELSTSSTQYSQVSSATDSTCTEGATVTQVVGPSAPPCGCVLVVSTSNGSLYASPDPKVGDEVCVEASFNDSSKTSINVTTSSGSPVFSASCSPSQAPAAGVSPVGHSCLALWNTENPGVLGNAIGAGTYHIVATGASPGDRLEANVTLS